MLAKFRFPSNPTFISDITHPKSFIILHLLCFGPHIVRCGKANDHDAGTMTAKAYNSEDQEIGRAKTVIEF
ncbi:MAG: hypothetical protein O2856_08360, partial [Planctomycetota bacterium]|nr:hypothetical protein [Planctomycetota bacterium]